MRQERTEFVNVTVDGLRLYVQPFGLEYVYLPTAFITASYQ